MVARTHRRPDFLIVGAPKAGTTAAAAALFQHPEVFLSPIKEPKFLTADGVPSPLGGPGDRWVDSLRVRRLEDYRRLFRRARADQMVGEASVDTLYYHAHTVPKIRRAIGRPRILIFLRDPTARAFSAWKQLVRDGRETMSFEDGLDREQSGATRDWEFMWSYVAVGRYAAQVESFLAEFDQVQVILHDELRADPQAALESVCAFLGIDRGHRFHFQDVHNPSAVPRHPLLRFVFAVGPLKVAAFRGLLRLGLSEHGLLAAVDRLRPRRVEKLEMAQTTRTRLRELYEPELRRLETLLCRSLDCWRA